MKVLLTGNLRRLSCLGLICLLAVSDVRAENSNTQKYFRLAEKDFTLAEARLIAGNNRDLKSAVQANLAAAAAIVLCERSQIKLSREKTRQTLQDSLLLMTPEAREDFQQKLQQNKLSLEQWLDQESGKLGNMLNEAVRRWYIHVYGSNSEITEQHIRNWYFRHQNIFRRLKLDPEYILAFSARDEEKFIQALAALRQGMDFDAARKTFAFALNTEAMDKAFHEANISRTVLDENFLAVKTRQYRFLLKKSAVKRIYLPLDEQLKQAIGNALFDALARARLAETLKKEFSNAVMEFY